jgi:hypothetical protein
LRLRFRSRDDVKVVKILKKFPSKLPTKLDRYSNYVLVIEISSNFFSHFRMIPFVDVATAKNRSQSSFFTDRFALHVKLPTSAKIDLIDGQRDGRRVDKEEN